MNGAGKYRKPSMVEKVRDDATPDETGKVDLADDGNWELYCARHVEERQITGREALQAQQPMGDVTGLYRMRSDPVTQGITPKMRLRIDGRKLNITRAITLNNPVREIELQCTEVVS